MTPVLAFFRRKSASKQNLLLPGTTRDAKRCRFGADCGRIFSGTIKLGGGNSNIFLFSPPKTGEDEAILMSICFKGVETTNMQKGGVILKNLRIGGLLGLLT